MTTPLLTVVMSPCLTDLRAFDLLFDMAMPHCAALVSRSGVV